VFVCGSTTTVFAVVDPTSMPSHKQDDAVIRQNIHEKRRLDKRRRRRLSTSQERQIQFLREGPGQFFTFSRAEAWNEERLRAKIISPRRLHSLRRLSFQRQRPVPLLHIRPVLPARVLNRAAIITGDWNPSAGLIENDRRFSSSRIQRDSKVKSPRASQSAHKRKDADKRPRLYNQ
jgi:hypothetical protein